MRTNELLRVYLPLPRSLPPSFAVSATLVASLAAYAYRCPFLLSLCACVVYTVRCDPHRGPQHRTLNNK